MEVVPRLHTVDSALFATFSVAEKRTLNISNGVADKEFPLQNNDSELCAATATLLRLL